MPLVLGIIGRRFIQSAGAMVLFGSSLFFLYGHLFPATTEPGQLNWTRALLLVAAATLVIAAPLQFITQTANLAGSWGAAFEKDSLSAALQMSFGKASVARTGLALAACAIAFWRPPGPRTWKVIGVLGALICASFAWMGHGAAGEGAPGLVHLVADILHSLGAAGWIGALVVFWLAIRLPAVPSRDLSQSLIAFSGTGTLIVALIVGTGVVNSVFLAGWNPAQAIGTRYGQVLAVKLALFVVMLVLAAANRFRHAPALARSVRGGAIPDLSALKASLMAETCTALLVLVAVSWLGTLAPVTAQ